MKQKQIKPKTTGPKSGTTKAGANTVMPMKVGINKEMKQQMKSINKKA